MTVIPFRKSRPSNSRNGACYVVKTAGGDCGYGFVHESASGDSSSWWGGFATMAEAEALQEARRRDCTFIPVGGA
jgi:hypothetical protein